MDALSSALAVLTAMITPAVLISACGTLILSTSTRLGRVVDRVRALSDRFEELASRGEGLELYEERRAVIFDQLDKLTSRARILQRSMVVFYGALGIFVASSVAIGLVAATEGARYSWIPVQGLLARSSSLRARASHPEARLAIATIRPYGSLRLGQALAPRDLVQQRSPHNNPLTLRRRP